MISGARLIRAIKECAQCSLLINKTTKTSCGYVESNFNDPRECEHYSVACPKCGSNKTEPPNCAEADWVCYSCNSSWEAFNSCANPFK